MERISRVCASGPKDEGLGKRAAPLSGDEFHCRSCRAPLALASLAFLKGQASLISKD